MTVLERLLGPVDEDGCEAVRGVAQRGAELEGPGYGSQARGWTRARLSARLASSDWLIVDVTTDDEREAGYRACWIVSRRRGRAGDRLFAHIERADSDDRPWQVRALGEVDRLGRLYGTAWRRGPG